MLQTLFKILFIFRVNIFAGIITEAAGNDGYLMLDQISEEQNYNDIIINIESDDTRNIQLARPQFIIIALRCFQEAIMALQKIYKKNGFAKLSSESKLIARNILRRVFKRIQKEVFINPCKEELIQYVGQESFQYIPNRMNNSSGIVDICVKYFIFCLFSGRQNFMTNRSREIYFEMSRSENGEETDNRGNRALLKIKKDRIAESIYKSIAMILDYVCNYLTELKRE